MKSLKLSLCAFAPLLLSTFALPQPQEDNIKRSDVTTYSSAPTGAVTPPGSGLDLRESQDEDNPHTKRNLTFLFVRECNQPSMTGTCTTRPLIPGLCYDRVYSGLGSMLPDKDVMCTVYPEPNCLSTRQGGKPAINGLEGPGWARLYGQTFGSEDWHGDNYNSSWWAGEGFYTTGDKAGPNSMVCAACVGCKADE